MFNPRTKGRTPTAGASASPHGGVPAHLAVTALTSPRE